MNTIKAAVLLSIAIAIVGMIYLQTSVETEPGNFTAYEAQQYLNRIYVSERTHTPRSSCGIFLPEDIPVEFFETSVYGKKRNSEEQIDLLPDSPIKPGQWLVLADLQDYSEVNLTMRICRYGIILAEKTMDIL